jgi:hypothetical protein
MLTTEPMMPVLYVEKRPTETVSSWYHRFPEVRRPWHHWQITFNAASDNQSAASAIANILLSHRQNLVRVAYELLLFPNSWPKNLGAAYTRANTVNEMAWITCYCVMWSVVWPNSQVNVSDMKLDRNKETWWKWHEQWDLRLTFISHVLQLMHGQLAMHRSSIPLNH